MPCVLVYLSLWVSGLTVCSGCFLPLSGVPSVTSVPPLVLVQVARAFRMIEEGGLLSSVPDPDVREILSKGEVYLYNVAGTSLGLQQLIVTIVEEQRELIYRAGPPPLLPSQREAAAAEGEL